MKYLEQLQSNSLAWLILSFCTIVSVYYGIKSNKKKRLQYNITTNPLITDSMSNIDGLSVSIDGVQIKNLSTTTIVFTNIGNDNFEKADFSKVYPLCITIQNGIYANLKAIDDYISERSLKNNNDVNCSILNDSQISVNFEYLKPRDSFKVSFLHTETVDVSNNPKNGKVVQVCTKKINNLLEAALVNLICFSIWVMLSLFLKIDSLYDPLIVPFLVGYFFSAFFNIILSFDIMNSKH